MKKLIFFLAALAVIFVGVTAWTADSTFKERKATEVFTDIDYFSMQEYSDTNVSAVMSALRTGKAKKIGGSSDRRRE